MKTGTAFIIMFLAAIMAMLSGITPAYAQGFDLTLTPAKVELEALPGESIEFTMELRNNGTDPLALLVYPMDYSVTPDNTFIFEEPGFYPYSSAAWIEIAEGTIEIPPASAANVPFKLEVPADAEPGGHYAVLFFQDASEPQPGQGAELVPRVGAQILLTVPGDIVREGEIGDFHIDSDFLSLWAPPAGGKAGWPARNIKYHLEVENTGNVHITVNAAISYSSSIGFGSGSLELGAMTILPGTVRYFDGFLPAPPCFGRYNAEALVMYGPDQFTFDTEKRAETGFTVIPIIWILVLILGAIALWWIVHLLRGRLHVSIGITRKGGGEGGGGE
jgi:hypothetical protein